MSLNGLDNADVTQAFTSAVAEPTGWFLLKYTSRDTVDLLGKGTGGVSEARTCLSTYADASPLYGLITFRRKRVLIKYIPERTSRLLQARTSVHFQGITEKFSPHDALLEIASADELNDTALAATFPLHAGSASANNLNEIAEDGEESAGPERESRQSVSSTTSKLSRKAALERVAALKRTAAVAPLPATSNTSDDLASSTQPEQGVATQHVVDTQDHDKTLELASVADSTTNPIPEYNSELTGNEPNLSSSITDAEVPPSPTLTLDRNAGSPVYHQVEDTRDPARSSTVAQGESVYSLEMPRASSDTAYLDSSGFRDLGIYEFKPKVKLAPRQVQIKEKKRASHMPASVKRHTSTSLATADLRSPKRDLEEDTKQTDVVAGLSAQPTDSPMIPDLQFSLPSAQKRPGDPAVEIPHRPQSSASFRSVSLRNSQHKVAPTPEKQRLMKAMEMRKRQHRKSQQATALQDVVESPTRAVERHASTIPEITESTVESGDLDVKSEAAVEASSASLSTHHEQKDSDSGIAIEPEVDTQEGLPPQADRTDSPHEIQEQHPSLDCMTSDVTTINKNDRKFPSPSPSLLHAVGADKPEDLQTENNVTSMTALRNVTSAAASEAVEEEIRTKNDSSAQDEATGSALFTDFSAALQSKVMIEDEDNVISPADVNIPTTAAGYEDLKTPGESNTATYLVEPPMSPLDQFSDHTSFFRESVSTQGLPPSRDGFLDTASEHSDHGKTWLSDGSGTRTRSSSIDSQHGMYDTQKRKRRGIVALNLPPIVTSTPSSVPHTDNASIDEDEFDYFGNATLHEATSMAVLRTPVLSSKPSLIQMSPSPTRQSAASDMGMSPFQKRKASPMTRRLDSREGLTPESDPRSSFMRAHSPNSASSSAAPEDLVALARKSQIGSGISQRIAKLAQSRSKETSPLGSPASLPQPSGMTARKSNQRLFESRTDVPWRGRFDGNNADFSKDRLRSTNTPSSGRLHSDARTGSPSKRQSHAYYTIHKDPETRRESVSVTARIVRPGARQEVQQLPTLQQPELSVRAPSPDRRVRELTAVPAIRRDPSVGSTFSRKSLESSKRKRFSFARGKSHESRPESSASGYASLRPPSPITEPVPPLPSSPPKGNRTSRFLKRMSGLSAVTRKLSVKPSTFSNAPPLSEAQPLDLSGDHHAFEPSLSEAMLDPTGPSSVRIGDVNVQFPHSGLWKRRFVEIDCAGKLIFSSNDMSSFPVRHREPAGLYSSSIMRAGVRSFDLKNVTAVYVPRPDDMELANSVVLSLRRDEGSIIVACEDGRGQIALLDLLQRQLQVWTEAQ